MTDYPREGYGALFNNPAMGNQPTWSGDLTLTPEIVQELQRLVQSGMAAKLRVVGWGKRGPKAAYVSLAATIDKKVEPARQRGQETSSQQEEDPYQPRPNPSPGFQRWQRPDQPRYTPQEPPYGPRQGSRPQRPAPAGRPQTPEFNDDIPDPFGDPNDAPVPPWGGGGR